MTPGTGRSLGTTPVIESPISSKDLAECPSGVFALYTNVTLDGYYPHMDVLGFGSSRDNLEPRVYTIEITLNPL